MVSKKKRFGDDEIPVFNDGCIYKRGDYWHFRLWLRDENKYARKSLNTTNRSTAIERGEAFYLELRANQQIGKKYFSLTAKEGVRLFRRNEVLIDSFDFPKLNPYHVDTNLIKRQTFTPEEYQKIIKTMRVYASKAKSKLDDDEWRMRQLMRHYFIIAANSGLRSGEQQQLRWSDIELVRNDKGQAYLQKILARIPPHSHQRCNGHAT